MALIASLIASPFVANAASDYDDLLQTTPSLYVHTDGSAKTRTLDISTTWWTDFKQSYAKRLEQNIGWPADFTTEFESIMTSNGSWGVYMQLSPEGNLLTIIGSHDPNAYCGFIGSASSGSYECSTNPGYGFVRAEYFAHNSYGGNGCIGSGINICSDNGMSIYTSPVIEYGTAGYPLLIMPNSTLSQFQFYFMNFDHRYPDGYEGTLIPSSYTPTYVAMGDSYSSGEGAFNYTPTSGECHRSSDSYAHYLLEYVQIGPLDLTACSGAVTDDLFNANPVNVAEDAQMNHLGDKTTEVTLTIGGNDVGFSDIVRTCADYYDHPGYLCSTNLTMKHSLAKAMSGLAGNGQPKKTADGRPIHSYQNVLSSIMAKAPNATVYIAGYPHLFGSSISDFTADAAAFGGAKCLVHNGIGTEVRVSYTDAQWLNEQADALNRLIEQAVKRFKSDHVVYVPPTNFENHGLCDSGYSYINGVVLDGTQPLNESFHPTTTGMNAYGYSFEHVINLP